MKAIETQGDTNNEQLTEWRDQLEVALREQLPETFQTNDEGTMLRTGYRQNSVRIQEVRWSEYVPEYRILSVSYKVEEQELMQSPIVSEGLMEIAVDPRGRLVLEGLSFLEGLPG